jgi:lysozyme
MSCYTYSKSRLALKEEFEATGGPRLRAYEDPLRRGILTIGYGHTGRDVAPGLTWTRQQCEDALAGDIHWAANVVNLIVTSDIDQPEFDALVDFVFHVGAKNFAESNLLKDLNAGKLEEAAMQFEAWDRGLGKVVGGMLRRRRAEATKSGSARGTIIT